MSTAYTEYKESITSGSWKEQGYDKMFKKLNSLYLESSITLDEYSKLMHMLDKALYLF